MEDLNSTELIDVPLSNNPILRQAGVIAERHDPRLPVWNKLSMEASTASSQAPVGTESDTHKVLGRWATIMIFITNEMGLGVLSLPSALQTLGIIPGVLAIVLLGILQGYTAYILLQFYRRYPNVTNIADCGFHLGGPWFQAFVGIAFVTNTCLIASAAQTTMSIALNTISGHAMCTVGWIAVPVVICWLLCIPRSLKFVAHMGIPSTVSIIAAVCVVVVAISLHGPQGAPLIFEKEIVWVGKPTLIPGMVACLNIAFSYAGNQAFVTVMAEMRDPGRDFLPSLVWLQAFAVIVYTGVAVIIYALAGQYTSSPALGAAPLLFAKIAYAVALPCLLGTGLVFGHTGMKYLFVVCMRALKAEDEIPVTTGKGSRRSWAVWVACGIAFWVAGFILANSIPVFSSMLSVSSAIFVAWFTYGISGLMWIHLNWGRQFESKKKTALALLNWGVLGIAVLMNTAGLYASVVDLMTVFRSKGNGINGPFTCGDNGIL